MKKHSLRPKSKYPPQRPLKDRRLAGFAIFGLAIIAVLVVAGCRATGPDPPPPAEPAAHPDLELIHVHGLGYSPDGTELYIPAHDGFRIYVNGGWQRPAMPPHDYMGYVATDDGFYSSGHPAPGAKLDNPLGLVKSTDGGKTMADLGFRGQSDFHVMSVGYHSHAIYALNPQANPRLPAGVHYSLDDGNTWQPSALVGLPSQNLLQLAVHPTEAGQIALAIEDGLYISDDFGQSVSLLGDKAPVTAAYFTTDGRQLYAGFKGLWRYDLLSQEKHALATPTLDSTDAISYIAVRPGTADEVAFATFNRNVYRSTDGARTWAQIARLGIPLAAGA